MKSTKKQNADSDSSGSKDGSLKARVSRAGGWAFLGHLGVIALRFATSLLMTRLLVPEIFGVMAVATSVHIVITVITDLGLPQAVIRSARGPDPKFLNTVWTLQILRGFAIWAACAGFALVLYSLQNTILIPRGSVYASSVLPEVIVAICFCAVIAGFRSMKAIVCTRDLDLRSLTQIELLSHFAGVLVAVALGWATGSIWSFVASAIVTTLLATLLSHTLLRGARDRLGWDRAALMEALHFGKWITLSSVLSALAANGDKLLLGAWLSPQVLGFYSIASSLVSLVDATANRVLGTVALPTFAEVLRRNPERFSTIYLRIRWLADPPLIGAAALMFVTGDWLVGLLYDQRYAPAGWMVQLLSFSLIFTRYTLPAEVFLSLGHSVYYAGFAAVKLLSLISIAPILAYAFGVDGAILGIAIHMMPVAAVILALARLHGFFNLRLELLAFGAWPLGALIGMAFLSFLRHL